MTLRDYLLSVRKHWALILALTLLGAAAGFGYAQIQPEIYRSQASVMVIPARGDNTSELVQGSNYVQSLVETYAVVATSPTVLDRVIDDLNLDVSPHALAGTVTVESPLNTVVLQIAVVSTDPQTAADIADAVAAGLADAVEDLSPQGADEQPAVRIETIAPARVPGFPISPNVRMLTLLGALGGLAAGVAFAVLRRLLATRIVTASDISAVTDLAVLGAVSATKGRSLPAVLQRDRAGRVAESMRALVANLRFANVDGNARVLLMTSAAAGEGKSSLAVAIALMQAEQGAKVLLIDADLRRASVHSYTNLEGAVGLTTVLLGDVSLQQATQQWGAPGLDVLTSGALPPNPGQLLTSAHLRELVQDARAAYDYVILDCAPVLVVSDPLWLAPVVDGILVVARSRSTKREALTRMIAALESTHTPVIGIILNGTKRTKSDSPYYYRANMDARKQQRRRKKSTAHELPTADVEPQ